MDPRQNLKTLQAHVAAARAAFEAGDRTKALEHLDQALAIDSSFLAAQLLRERVLSAPLVGGGARRSEQTEPVTPPPVETHVKTSAAPNRPILRSPAQAHERIELRARQRRVDHCVAATRAALGRGHLDQATTALSELMALEPNESNVTSLSAELADLRRRSSRRPFGVRLVAASAFLAVAGAASWLELPRRHVPVVDVTTAVKPTETVAAPAPLVADNNVEIRTPAPPLERIEQVTSSDRPAAQVTTPVIVASRPVAVLATRPTPPVSTTPPLSLPVPLSQLPPPAVTTPQESTPATLATASRGPSITTTLPPPTAATPAAASAAIAPSVTKPPEDQQLVEEALQRYRRAYGRLNVQSALAVYPTVNRVALARAFDGLESQSLTFDSCDVELRGAAARAICHGSARYVPKIGSRELHTEPLVWSFELRKSDGDWTIETAKASR